LAKYNLLKRKITECSYYLAIFVEITKWTGQHVLSNPSVKPDIRPQVIPWESKK
jgi:hypothetical protein